MPLIGSKSRSFVLLAASALFSLPLLAEVSSRYEEWRSGPVQWIMTSPEQKEWKGLKSDEDASRFIDLFWARRDPTADTPRNEYREEFDRRVKFADEKYIEPKKRGAMTDRGRVFIVLGQSTKAGTELSKSTRMNSSSGEGVDPTAGRTLGARETWLWEGADAQRFKMSKIEVVFIENPYSKAVIRDTQRNDWFRASTVAIESAVVKPDLKEVPSWAIQGGLEPKIVVPFEPARKTTTTVSSTETVEAVKGEAGASRLTLVEDAGAINPGASKDPFASATPMTTFKRSTSLGWAVQYCPPGGSAPTISYLVRIAGGEGVDFATPPKKTQPDALRAIPGCYALRGVIPLSSVAAGDYQLTLMFDDLSTGKDFELRQNFTVVE
jgi:GWxTD domain-containing protein